MKNVISEIPETRLMSYLYILSMLNVNVRQLAGYVLYHQLVEENVRVKLYARSR